MDTKMLIGGSIEAGTETEETILNPKTGSSILELPEASQAQIDARRCRSRHGLRHLVADHAGGALELSPEDRRRRSKPRPMTSPRLKRSIAASRSMPC